MRLLCITDIHSNRRKFESILGQERQPDVLLLGGDFTNFGTPQEAEELLDLALLYCPRVLAVAGNCDSAAIDEMLKRREVTLHRQGREIDGLGFFGLSAMPIWRGDMYEFSEQQLDGFLGEGYNQVQGCARLVLVSHPPPRDTAADRNNRGSHVGSIAVRTWIDKVKPLLVVCGHIHEARGAEQWQGVSIVNCGPARDGYYAVAEAGEKVEVALKHV